MTNTDTEIRAAQDADLERIFAIYNVEVEQGIATFDVEPMQVGSDDHWLSDREAIHPVIVATIGGEVAGWASLSAWSPRGAYRRTAEVSVYVDRSLRGEGIGRRLLEAMVERARELELGVLLARVALPNPASTAIHEAAGFKSFGVQRRCGEKLGRIIDVDLMDLHLDES